MAHADAENPGPRNGGSMDDSDGGKGQVEDIDGGNGCGAHARSWCTGKRGGSGAFCWSGPVMMVAPYSGWLPAKKMCGHSSMMNGSSSLRGKHAKVSAPPQSQHTTINGMRQRVAVILCVMGHS